MADSRTTWIAARATWTPCRARSTGCGPSSRRETIRRSAPSIDAERKKALAELDRVKSDVELQKKAIADLEEQARQQNVPAGWLR